MLNNRECRHVLEFTKLAKQYAKGEREKRETKKIHFCSVVLRLQPNNNLLPEIGKERRQAILEEYFGDVQIGKTSYPPRQR